MPFEREGEGKKKKVLNSQLHITFYLLPKNMPRHIAASAEPFTSS